MKRATVSIDTIASEFGDVECRALTKAQRRALIAIGAAGEGGLRARTSTIHRRLVEKGYAIHSFTHANHPHHRFALTELGALRYRAELSHQRHCAGCSMCEGTR